MVRSSGSWQRVLLCCIVLLLGAGIAASTTLATSVDENKNHVNEISIQSDGSGRERIELTNSGSESTAVAEHDLTDTDGSVYFIRVSPALTDSYAKKGIRINEIVIRPGEGEHEWIELANSGTETVSLSGHALTDEDGNWYVFPNDLPSIPPDAFVVVVFDGAGREANDYDFSDNVAVLHTRPGLIDILEDDYDQVSLYADVSANLHEVTADFAQSVSSGTAPLTVEFSDTSTYSGAAYVDEWYWEFGDGASSTETNPSHTYETPGMYTPALKVTDTMLGLEDTKIGLPITVTEPELGADSTAYVPIVLSATDSGLLTSEHNRYIVSTEEPTATPDQLISFVAWGAEPGSDANNAEAAFLWSTDWYVDLTRGLGVSGDIARPGESIGLLPGSDNEYPSAWEIFRTSEVTFGSPNEFPTLAWLSPTNGSVIAASTVVLSWAPQQDIAEYRIQLDDVENFSSPLVDTTISEPRYVHPGVVPAGIYYWRVQSKRVNGSSSWSSDSSFEAVDFQTTNNNLPDNNSTESTSTRKTLGITWQLQHKDTNMLDLEGSLESGLGSWDLPHEGGGKPVIANNLDAAYCVRASVSMIASFYGGRLSQDIISYQFFSARRPGPETDLGHGKGVSAEDVTEWLDWALGDSQAVEFISGKPSFNEIKQWIDEGRPIGSVIDGHMRVVDGYDSAVGFIHLLDPWAGEVWMSYESDPVIAVWVAPPGRNGAPNVRSDDDQNWNGRSDAKDDSDGDGLADFDERNRFFTDPHNSDSDQDGVLDKNDIRGYVFDSSGRYSLREPDFDNDGSRKELDPDNDRKNNDGSADGCEDINRNGKLDPGETSNFDPNQEGSCNYKPCDQSPNLVYPQNGSDVNTLIPHFGWRSLTREPDPSFIFELAKDPGFSNLILQIWTTYLGGARDIYEIDSYFDEFPEARMTYYWRVSETCSNGKRSTWSDGSFTIVPGGLKLPPPTRTSPTNGANLSNSTVFIQWQPVQGAHGYMINYRKVGQEYWSLRCFVSAGYYEQYGGFARTLEANTTYEWTMSTVSDYSVGEPASQLWRFKTPP